MKKRMLAIMMSALMAAGVCSGVTVYADADSKTLTVGFDAEYPPFGYMDESGEYVGFDLRQPWMGTCEEADQLGFQGHGAEFRKHRLHLERLHDQRT